MITPAAFWAGFPHDPRETGNAGLRAADADRDRVRDLLSQAYADGRLDRQEHDDRSAAVAAARTLGELPGLVGDLVPLTSTRVVRTSGLAQVPPDQLRTRAVAAYERDRRAAFASFVGPSAVCTIIWALTGAGFFWPGFVIAALLLNVVRVVVRRTDLVEDHLRGLERRQAKDLRKLRYRP